jgi:hypothetical protein
MEERFVSIDEMKEKLGEFGNRQVWLSIEKLGKWQDRVAFRQLFFLAGGNLEEEKFA